MKKLLATFSAVAALGLIAAQAVETLTVAATPMPHVEVLNVVRPPLARESVELKVREFTDYAQPNAQVSGKCLNADFFQRQPCLDEFNKAKSTDLIAVTDVHIGPLSAYSSKYKKLDELSSDATVVIPNDATNSGHTLLLLNEAGVIELKDNKSTIATPRDIVDSLRNIKIHELETATLPRVLTQVNMTLINTNYALKAKPNPTEDALAIEGSDSPYVNTLIAWPDNKDSDAMQKPAKALHSAEVKQFIQGKYRDAVVPAF